MGIIPVPAPKAFGIDVHFIDNSCFTIQCTACGTILFEDNGSGQCVTVQSLKNEEREVNFQILDPQTGQVRVQRPFLQYDFCDSYRVRELPEIDHRGAIYAYQRGANVYVPIYLEFLQGDRWIEIVETRWNRMHFTALENGAARVYEKFWRAVTGELRG